MEIDLHEDFLMKFCKRIWLRHQLYIELLGTLGALDVFLPWRDSNTDLFGVEASPMSLLLLCALWCLGRGWNSHDI